MADSLATYSFLSWSRQGVAAAIPAVDQAGSRLPAQAHLNVNLSLNGAIPVTASLRVYGPGDVTGIDTRQVVRTDPHPHTRNFEPNYFPAVEFDRPDFPWLFTPAKADPQGRLRPWICLVVVKQQEGVRLKVDRSQPLAVLEIKGPASPAKELPDLSQSWAWAHGQVAGSLGAGETLQQVIAAHPERTISRLLCPRKLAPHTTYHACVVPAFEPGRKAGLGLDVTDADLAELRPAWTVGSSAPTGLQLPVYYHWEFSTGATGDFESLVRLLEPRVMPPEVGQRPMDVSQPGPGLPELAPDAPGALLGLEGALRSPQSRSTPWPNAARIPFQAALRELLDAPEHLAPEEGEGPNAVGPPIYGRWHAATKTVPADSAKPHWVRELNLDPRNRAVAGFGTQVVQDQQEQLMAAAWEQIGEVERANQLLRQAQLARAATLAIHKQHLTPLPPGALLQMTAAVHARVLTSQITVAEEIRRSPIPPAALSAAFRRIARPRGPMARRFYPPEERQIRPIIERLNDGTLVAAPPRRSPAGTVHLDDVTDLAVEKGIKDADQLRYQAATPEAIAKMPSRPEFGIFPEEGPAAKPTPGKPGGDTEEAARFREAAMAHQERLLELERIQEPPVPRPLDLEDLRNTLLLRLDPNLTIPARVLGRLKLPPGFWEPEDPIAPIMAHPVFPQPMYAALRDYSQELLLPGLDKVLPNTITVLETNPTFIESYMVGLNQEMGRELLWREYPTDQRGSYFRQFWDVQGRVPPPVTEQEREAARDIPPIHTWSKGRHLGQNLQGSSDKPQMVLLIRGELLRRFPTAVVYVAKAEWDAGQRRRKLGTEERYPLFYGTLQPDVTFIGFDLTVEEAKGTTNPSGDQGWFVVIQEQPTEPRFGLDEPTSFGGSPTGWDDLSWGDLVANEADYAALTHIDLTSPRPDTRRITAPPGVAWGRNAAQMAYITMQKPMRIAIHADDMLPP